MTELPPAYAIYLHGHPERRDHLLSGAKAAGFEVTLCEGLDARLVGFHPGQGMTAGHMGCCLSHWFTWQQIARDDPEWFIVLEDDADITPEFPEKTLEALETAKEQNLQLVYLGWQPPAPKNQWHAELVLEDRGPVLTTAIGYPYCTHALLIHRSALPTMIDLMRKPKTHVDIQLGRDVLPHLRWALATEPICYQAGFRSLTERDRPVRRMIKPEL